MKGFTVAHDYFLVLLLSVCVATLRHVFAPFGGSPSTRTGRPTITLEQRMQETGFRSPRDLEAGSLDSDGIGWFHQLKRCSPALAEPRRIARLEEEAR